MIDVLTIDEFLSTTHSKEEWVEYCRAYVIPFAGRELLDFATKGGFFEAPASTRYHGACLGGLVKHSLAVVDMTTTLIDAWHLPGSTEWMQDAIIASFFHDLCKMDLYVEVKKWRKDEFGKWESYSGYDVRQETIQIGHGSESLRIIEKHYTFNTEAWAQAVAWHMGLPDDWVGKQQYSKAVEKYPEILALHTADAYASYVKGL